MHKKWVKYFNFIVLMLTLLLFAVPTINSSSRQLIYDFDQPRIAKIIDVIDGEVIKVWYYYGDFEQPEIKIIKLIGIDTNGYQDAYELTLNSLLGSTVFIVHDDHSESFPVVDNLAYEYAYVYKGFDQTFNEELVLAGLASVNEEFHSAAYYNDLVEAEATAKLNDVGIWDYDDTDYDPIVNINLATYAVLQETLIDVTDEEIYDIISYRRHNPYNTIDEIKFASDTLDKEWLEKNKDNLSVITNINNANLTELISVFSLSSLSEEIAQDIIDYRIFNEFNSVSDVNNIVDAMIYYDTVSDYLTIEGNTFYEEVDKVVANINTCNSKDFIEATDLGIFSYGNVEEYRLDSEYDIKSINELVINGNPLSYLGYSKYIDDLTVCTNINTAYEFELMSLFGMYDILSDEDRMEYAEEIISNRPFSNISELEPIIGNFYEGIEPYITAYDSYNNEYININTANPDYVSNYLELSNAAEERYEKYRDNNDYYEAPEDINFSIDGIGDKITLYTNINTASYFEIYHLDKDMPSDLVYAIIELREDEVITSTDELIDLFIEYEATAIYSKVKDFIVFY